MLAASDCEDAADDTGVGSGAARPPPPPTRAGRCQVFSPSLEVKYSALCAGEKVAIQPGGSPSSLALAAAAEGVAAEAADGAEAAMAATRAAAAEAAASPGLSHTTWPVRECRQ